MGGGVAVTTGGQDHFALFGLQPVFALDRARLDARYRELQRVVHPDRFAAASDQERRIAMQQAARLNEAYRVLCDPLARARYLLELRGHRPEDEQQTHRDPVFLMEQMELREALEAAETGPDPLAAVAAVMDRIASRSGEVMDELAAALAGEDEAATAAALQAVQRLQFFRRLEEEAGEREARLLEQG